MAEAPTQTLDLPSGPPAGVAPPPPPPAPTKTIKVTAAGMDAGPPPTPPKKGSAMDRMRQELQKKAQPTNAPEKPPSASPTEAESPPPQEGSSPLPNKPGAATTAEDRKKVSPWKLVDEYKGKVAMLEKEVAEARTTRLDPKEKEELVAKVSTYERELNELREEIRYVNYTKHPEFKDKYQKPYEDAWRKAMSDLSELTVEDSSTGQQRPVSAQDMLELVQMPLQKAREQATALFGDFADDVMAHRKEIKNLFDAQQQAIDEARKNGAKRDKEMQERHQQMAAEIQRTITEAWTRANDEIMKDEKHSFFFKPVEGDEEGNRRLAKGYELADKAWSMSPLDPRLTPQQRAEIVKTHAAIRNRAAAAGRLLFWYRKAQEENKTLRTELDKYRGTEPGKGQGVPAAQPAAPASARDGVFGALRKLAH